MAMLIRTPRPWELPEREVTPESVYLNRRRFLGTAAFGMGGLAAGLGWPFAASAEATPPLRPLDAPRNARYVVQGRDVTPEAIVAHWNNFYEFGVDKRRVADEAASFLSRPWHCEVRGLVEKPFKFDAHDLLKRFPLEERVYRMRCVEAWSVVVPWVGVPLTRFLQWARPTAKAKYLRMVSFYRPNQALGQREMTWYPWPYFEALRLDEAANELALLVVGSYGHVLPNQNGAPLRLIAPWKYGFKSIKSITLFEFTDSQPRTFWNTLNPEEYDFLSNVNPAVPHPRWSQATEEDIGRRRRITTLPYNGYASFVAPLYR